MRDISKPAAVGIMFVVFAAFRLLAGLLGWISTWSPAELAVPVAISGAIMLAVLVLRRRAARAARRQRFEAATAAARRDLADAEQAAWIGDMQVRRAAGAAGHAPPPPTSWDPPSPAN